MSKALLKKAENLFEERCCTGSIGKSSDFQKSSSLYFADFQKSALTSKRPMAFSSFGTDFSLFSKGRRCIYTCCHNKLYGLQR